MSNLHQLKNSLELYIEKELDISTLSSTHKINLVAIARQDSQEEMIKLLELVVYAVVNCPQKELFINRIMGLDQDTQIHLKNLIEGTSQDILRYNQQKEYKNLLYKIQFAEEECLLVKEKNAQLIQERNEMRVTISEMEDEIIRMGELKEKPVKPKKSLTKIFDDTLIDKENYTLELQRLIDQERKKHSEEIKAMSFELELANVDITQLTRMERQILEFKQKVMELTSFRSKYEETLQTTVDQDTIIREMSLKVGDYVKNKQDLKNLKEELRAYKDKMESSTFHSDNKNKSIKKLEFELRSYRERIEKLKATVTQLENENMNLKESNSEDDSMSSIVTGNLQDDLLQVQQRRESRIFTFVNFMDNKEPQLKEEIVKKKAQIKQLKENLQMQNEDFEHTLSSYIEENKFLIERVRILKTHIEDLNVEVNESEDWKSEYAQAKAELKSAKEEKDNMIYDIKRVYGEKEILYKRLIAAKDNIFELNTLISNKELIIRQKELNEHQLEEKVNELKKTEQLYQTQLEHARNQTLEGVLDDARVPGLERELLGKTCEISSLNFTLIEKDKIIQGLQTEKSNTIKNIQKEHEESTQKLIDDHKNELNDTISKTEEALHELTNEKQTLVQRLNSNRRRTINMEQVGVSIQDPQLQTLKNEIEQYQKDIEYLTIANVELKSSWKETTRMLRQVWKIVGTETKKLESVHKRP